LLEEKLCTQVKINSRLSNEISKSAAFIEKLTAMLKRKRMKDLPDVPRLSVFEEDEISSIKCLESSFSQIECLAKEIHKLLRDEANILQKGVQQMIPPPDDLPTGFSLTLGDNDVQILFRIFLVWSHQQRVQLPTQKCH
jgi:hypothetical protein